MVRVTVLVSGGGTNLQALIDAERAGNLGDAKIVRVISNNPGVYALERAKAAGIEAIVLSPKTFEKRELFDEALLASLREAETDLVVLAGCLVTIAPSVVAAYENRILNIHPALIPSFCGKGCYGLKVHEKALERGVKVSGATVHFVDAGVDSGPIVLQKAVEVREGDTPEVLQRRIMEEAEWKILPEAVRLFSLGKLSVEGKRVRILP